MAKFPELYKPYNDILKQELGLDWFDLCKVAESYGNGPGIYPDTAAYLFNLIKLDRVQNVLELGSGSSTVFLSASCKKFNKTLYSIEESPYWKTISEKLVNHYDIQQEINLLDTWRFDKMPAPDLIFLDSESTRRPVLLDHINNSKWHSEDTEILILDDAENLEYRIPVMRQLSEQNRFNTWYFNPIGRQDRSLLINVKDETFNSNEWFWEWKPDKVYW